MGDDHEKMKLGQGSWKSYGLAQATPDPNYFYVLFLVKLVYSLLLIMILEILLADCSFGVWHWGTASQAHNDHVPEHISIHWHQYGISMACFLLVFGIFLVFLGCVIFAPLIWFILHNFRSNFPHARGLCCSTTIKIQNLLIFDIILLDYSLWVSLVELENLCWTIKCQIWGVSRMWVTLLQSKMSPPPPIFALKVNHTEYCM